MTFNDKEIIAIDFITNKIRVMDESLKSIISQNKMNEYQLNRIAHNAELVIKQVKVLKE